MAAGITTPTPVTGLFNATPLVVRNGLSFSNSLGRNFVEICCNVIEIHAARLLQASVYPSLCEDILQRPSAFRQLL